jgi:hypothetical protein
VTPDEQLVIIFATLHLVALMLGGALFAMFLKSDEGSRPDGADDDENDGGGGNDRITDKPKTSPSGGIPLPDAEPAPVRLRGHDRLSDLRPRPLRRPAREPQRSPVRRRVGA